jgi:hypothetical protein
MNIWLSIIAAASVLLAGIAVGMYIRERRIKLRLSQELATVSRQLANKSDRDALSGLLTRIGFDVLLARKGQKTDRSGEPFTLLYVALDNFGMLNDGWQRNGRQFAARSVASTGHGRRKEDRGSVMFRANTPSSSMGIPDRQQGCTADL